MLTIRIAGMPLWLKPGTTLSLEYNSPLFADEVLRGTFSYSFTLPLSAHNRAVFGYPDLVESVADLRRVFDECEVEDAGYLVGQRGQLRIRTITPTTLSVTVAFGLSAAAKDVRERVMQSFELGGERVVPGYQPVGDFAVPGIVVHANEVVAAPERFDYVFAPLLNHFGEEPATEDNFGVPPTLLNPWVYSDVGLFGLPVRGTFLYRLTIYIPGAVSQGDTGALPYAPFPRLGYLLRTVFQELGFPLRSTALVGELADLVVLHGNQVGGSFRLADLLPALPLGELLQKLRATLGLIADVGHDGQLDLLTWQQVLDSREYADWSAVAAPYFLSREVEDVQGRTLTYHVASDDERAAAFFQGPPAGVPVAEPVATLADLPVADTSNYFNPPRDEVRLVSGLQTYYRQQVVVDLEARKVTAEWVVAGSVYEPVPVAGGGEEQEQGIAGSVVESYVLQTLRGHEETTLLTGITEEPYAAGSAERSTELRLGFYRGRQPFPQDPAANYPLVTPFSRNAAGDEVGAYSLQLHGPTGTVAKLVGEWLELVATATPIKHTFYLTPRHLAELRFSRKVMVHGNLYLVRQVQVTLPITKGATVTLIPLPRG